MPRKAFVLGAAAALVAGLAGWHVSTSAHDAAQEPAAVPTGRQLSPPWYNFSPDVPPDVVTQDLGAIGLQPFVDVHAWDLFVAVNWPASATQRGVPDRNNVIGGVPESPEGGGGQPSGPTVWETFKDTADVFLNPPVKPAPFNAPESVPPACRQLAAADPEAARRTLTTTAKAADVLDEFRQAFTLQPLVDQNGQLVWYEVKVNEAWYDYVVNNGYYDSRRQPPTGISFPAGSNDGKGLGALKVKAAWKVMGLLGSRQPDDLTRFYTTRALVYDPATDKCSRQLVGLVGLHIVHKTRTLNQWAWATFEQIDNAPTKGRTIPAGARYNFFDPACAACPVNRPPPNLTTPVQVQRVVPIDDNAASQNALFQPALAALRRDGNVWRYYQLVNAQWRQDPNVKNPPQPAYLANTTLETYLQDPVPDPKAPHGCLNCHSLAVNKDFDFQLFKAYPKSAASIRALLGPGASPHE
jgi:hypothetical protein